MYKIIKVKGTEYKLRMTSKSIVEIEKKLGENPLNVFMSAMSGVQFDETGEAIVSTIKMPKLTDMIYIFWGALLPLNANINFDAACDLCTDYMDDGRSYEDFLNLITEIFIESGFMRKPEKETVDETEKN